MGDEEETVREVLRGNVGPLRISVRFRDGCTFLLLG